MLDGNFDIPFEERCLELPSGFSIIWPFRNQKRKFGATEILLDNNALSRSVWLREISGIIGSSIAITPMHALSEQWLSNPDFKARGKHKIESLFAPFIKFGLKFEENYAENLINLLKANEAAFKSQWMIGYLYALLLYRIVSSSKGDRTAEDILLTLNEKDVPVFAGCNMLCVLALYLKDNPQVKMIGDDKPAFSYVAGFSALHKSKKNEVEFDEHYLRNRAGDLSMWMYIPLLTQVDYQNIGQMAVVTSDKALKKLIFRCLPPVLFQSRQMAFSFDERSFDSVHSNAILKRMEQLSGKAGRVTSRSNMLYKLENLKTHVLLEADEVLIKTAEKVWEDWIVPGFYDSFVV